MSSSPKRWTKLAERAAVELIQDAGGDPNPIQIAYALLGQDCFRYLPKSTIAGGAALLYFRERDRWFIYIAKTFRGRRLVHAVGHELGHFYCARKGMRMARADEEQFADGVGSAILARWEATA